MERPKRELSSEDEKEDSQRAERIGMDQPSSARTSDRRPQSDGAPLLGPEHRQVSQADQGARDSVRT